MLEREGVAQQCYTASGSADGGKCHWKKTSASGRSVLVLARAVQKRAESLEPCPRGSPCPLLCSKVEACKSELPLTAVHVICS